MHSINLLKIGSVTMTDVTVGSSAIYDAIETNSDVACIFSYDKRILYVVNNFSNQMNFGMEPNWGHLSLYMWISLILGGIFSYSGVTSLSLISTLIGVAGLGMARVFQLALKRSREIWQIAVTQVQQQ